MSIPVRLAGAIGHWEGHNKLWFEPNSAAIECATTAEVRGEAAGRCDMAWADSFHNGHRLMPLTGPAAGEGVPDVRGSYAAPPGPDWGWRITLEHLDADALALRMYNVTPDGTEALAVEASYARRH